MKRIKPSEGNKTFCMAPWTHTYLSPQTERRMCCASREPAQSFKQYIDTGNDAKEYKPLTLKEHWNSDHMKSVRLRMMAGEELSECEVCDHKLLNTDVYRSYWNQLFNDRVDEAYDSTDESTTYEVHCTQHAGARTATRTRSSIPSPSMPAVATQPDSQSNK